MGKNHFFEKIAGAVFMTKENYFANYNATEQVNFAFNDKRGWSFSIEGDKKVEIEYVDSKLNEISGHIITKDRIKTGDNITLAENEIVLSLDLYNQLFPNAKINVNEDNIQKINLEDLNLSSLDNKLSLSLKHETLDTNFWDVKDLVIKGIYIYKNVGNIIFMNPSLQNQINPEWETYANRTSILLFENDYKKLENTLNYIRDNFSLSVDSEVAVALYMVESVMSDLSKVFFILLAISLLSTILLLINLISFGVSARTKEIGVLKALGTGNGELGKAYLFETLIISTVSFIIGFFLTRVFVDFANTVFVFDGSTPKGIIWFIQTPISYLLMAFQTFILMPLLTFVPLRKITKLTPVDAIKK